MNISQEFAKVRTGFLKVREDMNYLATKVSENTDHFFKEHSMLKDQIENLTEELKTHLATTSNHVKEYKHLAFDPKELNSLKAELRDLKKIVSHIEKDHKHVTQTLDEVKQTSKKVKELDKVKEKLQSNELEIYLLKERLIEKDIEMKHIKDVSQKLFEIVDDLSRTELEILNHTQ